VRPHFGPGPARSRFLALSGDELGNDPHHYPRSRFLVRTHLDPSWPRTSWVCRSIRSCAVQHFFAATHPDRRSSTSVAVDKSLIAPSVCRLLDLNAHQHRTTAASSGGGCKSRVWQERNCRHRARRAGGLGVAGPKTNSTPGNEHDGLGPVSHQEPDGASLLLAVLDGCRRVAQFRDS
jgi:hypothetical protein